MSSKPLRHSIGWHAQQRSPRVPCGAADGEHALDQIIDAAMARALHADACRVHALVGWVVMRDTPEYPDKVVARLVTDVPSPYLLMSDTLAEIHAKLPLPLARKARQPVDPPAVVEIWVAA
jgi:hypothetical protein